MLQNRIIPCLLINQGQLVKTKKFSNERYIGDPINAIKIFNEKEVDEIIVLDITASKKNTSPNFKLINEFASECFMPLTYGGGIKNIDDASKLFSIGVEKISIQTGYFDNYKLIENIAKKYGSQSVVVSIDIKKKLFLNKKIYFSSLNKFYEKSDEKLINDLTNAGAGEILLNFIDREGTMSGMDLEYISLIKNTIKIPLIAMGGVGKLKDIRDAIDAGASAVACGSFFIFHGPHNAVLITYPSQSEINNLLNLKI